MLEQGDVLLTWQLLKDLAGPDPFPVPARRLGDHRKAYLTYEGPLSGNRGHVRRIDEGTLELHAVPGRYTLTLSDPGPHGPTAAADAQGAASAGPAMGHLRGTFTLTRQPDGHWLLVVADT
jgi:hypothetical protein